MKKTIVISPRRALVNSFVQFSNAYGNAKTNARRVDILIAAAVTVTAWDNVKPLFNQARISTDSFPETVERLVTAVNAATGDPMEDERNERDAVTAVISAIVSESEKFWGAEFVADNAVTAVFRDFYRDNGAEYEDMPPLILSH